MRASTAITLLERIKVPARLSADEFVALYRRVEELERWVDQDDRNNMGDEGMEFLARCATVRETLEEAFNAR